MISWTFPAIYAATNVVCFAAVMVLLQTWEPPEDLVPVLDPSESRVIAVPPKPEGAAEPGEGDGAGGEVTHEGHPRPGGPHHLPTPGGEPAAPCPSPGGGTAGVSTWLPSGMKSAGNLAGGSSAAAGYRATTSRR
mgnify:CR=1 FL=1